MQKILVIKFGGTSLMTPERIKSAALIVADIVAKGRPVIVAVSAMGHTTDELIKLSSAITEAPDKRELDALMATGEQVSATLMTMALQAMGIKARSFNGAQAGISTNNLFGNAKIESVNAAILNACVASGCTPVVTGFQGATARGETTTLGRGGSDTTAIALAAALNAERCDIYTDVDGVYSADPRLVKNAVKLKSVSVAEMLELAKNGAQVLNAHSVEIAQSRNVLVRVRSTFCPEDEGTLISGTSDKSRCFTGVTLNSNINCIEINLKKLEMESSVFSLPRLQPATKHGLLKKLAAEGISAEIVEPLKANPFQILLLVRKDDTSASTDLLRTTTLSIKDITVRTELATVSLVAPQVSSRHEVESVKAMILHKIPIRALGCHSLRLTLLMPSCCGAEAISILHSHFAGVELAA